MPKTPQDFLALYHTAQQLTHPQQPSSSTTDLSATAIDEIAQHIFAGKLLATDIQQQFAVKQPHLWAVLDRELEQYRLQDYHAEAEKIYVSTIEMLPQQKTRQQAIHDLTQKYIDINIKKFDDILLQRRAMLIGQLSHTGDVKFSDFIGLDERAFSTFFLQKIQGGTV